MKRSSLPRQRREFISLLVGAAAWPIAAHAQGQQSTLPVIGLLGTESLDVNVGLAARISPDFERSRLRGWPQCDH